MGNFKEVFEITVTLDKEISIGILDGIVDAGYF